MKKLQSNTTYFLAEGKTNLRECISLSFKRAVLSGVRTIVIFTANGEGVELACTDFLTDERYQQQRVVAVSFPYGTVPDAAIEIPAARAQLFQRFHIQLLRAANPFDDRQHTVRKTLEIFSGGFSLCVWAILVACDAGVINSGEHVIGCCADTAILAKATPSSHFFSSFAVREIVCKPLIHDLSKGESLAEEINAEALIKHRRKRAPLTEQKQLPQDLESSVPKKVDN